MNAISLPTIGCKCATCEWLRNNGGVISLSTIGCKCETCEWLRNKMMPHDLHMHLGEGTLVMVQWGNPPYEGVALLTVSRLDREGNPTGGSANLQGEDLRRVIQALQGDAPICTCRVCSDPTVRIQAK